MSRQPPSPDPQVQAGGATGRGGIRAPDASSAAQFDDRWSPIHEAAPRIDEPLSEQAKRSQRRRHDLQFMAIYGPLALLPMLLLAILGEFSLSAARNQLALVTAGISCLLLLATIYAIYRRSLTLQAKQDELEHMVVTDPLTRLGNRRALAPALAMEGERSERSASPVALLMMDLDRFKSVNDRLGHNVGDAVLQAFGDVLRDGTREGGDLLLRIGGDEFVALLPATGDRQGRVVARRVHDLFVERILPMAPGVGLGCSIGLAVRLPGEEGSAWLDRADRAMYHAKEQGRALTVASESLRRHGLVAGPGEPGEQVELFDHSTSEEDRAAMRALMAQRQEQRRKA